MIANNFEAVWTTIAQKLRPGAVVRIWGAACGYTGGTFGIRDVERTSITVSVGNKRMPRLIVEEVEFREGLMLSGMICLWEIPSVQDDDAYRRSITYIFGILHHVLNL